jgi:hypothetical protein
MFPETARLVKKPARFRNKSILQGGGMKAVVFGLVLLAAAITALIPSGLNWFPDLLAFMRGCLPILAALLGLAALFIGAADIKDRAKAKKEEKTGDS